MKKFFLCLLMSLIGMFCSVEAQTIAFADGFESGDFSTEYGDWIQEAVVGNTAWQIESAGPDLEFPSTVLFGNRRAYLRNTTGETQGYVTRLITPVMRLDTVYKPILRFWYANPKWTADRDTLRVLYKDAPNADWKLLREFSTAQANWQKVEMALPMYSEAYQIAFEGKDNLGHGIVLDSVIVRSTPECTVPHDVIVNNLGAGNVNIAWTASWDANQFEVVVTKYVIDPDTIEKIPADQLAFHDFTKTGLQQNIDVTLVSGEYYYVFVRSICDGETSAWNSQKGYHFRVKATKNVPYYDPIDMPSEPGIARRDLEWTWRNDLTGSVFIPYINVGDKDNWDKYSKNGTTAIVFRGAPFTETPIPSNKYAYVATPALDDTLNANFALNQCQVRFWSTVAGRQGRAFAHSLIVGVMTDPEDVASFTPVDTVSVWGTSTFVENVVDLSSYQGDGNYVAFMSAFDTQNYFYIDDIAIEYRTALTVPSDIYVNPRDTWAQISWKGNATTYNVVITNEEVNPDKATAAQIVDQVNGVTSNSYKTEALEADHSWNRPYFVYVQAVDGEKKSAWSYRYPFVTIAAQREVPYTIDFEKSSGTYTIGEATTLYPTGIGIFSNDPEYPHCVQSNPHGGSYSMTLTKDWGNDSWITLPMVDTLGGKQVKFYLRCSSDPEQVNAVIGVMTNPMDISTFIPVNECKAASSGYVTAYANFENYTGPQGVLAIVWGDVERGKQTINYIDDVTVDSIAKCLPPVNMQIVPESDSATVSWTKSEATTWEFVLSSKQLTTNQLENLTFDSISHLANIIFADTLTWTDPLNNPTFGFDSLVYNTSYYIYVRTMCEDEKTWWTEATFKTICPENFPIPFKEDFESYSTGAYEDGFNCWQVADYVNGATGYPKILNPSSGAQDGNMLELWSTTTTHRNLAMLPGLDADFKTVVLSFDARSYGTSTKSVLYVGSMGDINDWTSFVAIDTIYMDGGNEFTKIRMDLANYTLAYNNIVFTSGLAETLEMNSDLYIDNVVVKPNTCIEAWNMESTNIQSNSIDIKWDGKSTGDEWIVKVMSAKDSTFVIKDTTVVGKAFHAEGLEPVSKYTFYVKPSCDTIWTEASYYTACVKLDPTKPNKETFEEYPSGTSYNASYQAPCWTVGNGNPSATTTYIPYIYKTTSTYAASGTNCYRLYPTATYSPTWVAAPEVDCNSLSELLVTFSFYGSTSYYILPGVMTDPEDLTTFVVLDSIKGQGKIATISMDLSEYADQIPASAKYVAWRTAYNAGPTIYLDDISIVKITCPLPKPSYSGLTAEQVRISSGLRTDNKWILLMTDTLPKDFSVDMLSLVNVDSLVHNDSIWKAHVVYYDTIDARNQLVTGLTEQTEYYAAIATACDDGVSQWSLISFRTPCLALTPEAMGTITFSKKDGYVPGSSATRYMPCWTVGNKSGNAGATSTYIPYVYTTSTYLYDAGVKKDSVLCVLSYSPTSATSTKYNGAYAIMPELNVEDISKYQVNFYARAHSTASYGDQLIVGVVTDPADLNTFVAVDTLKLSKSAYEAFSVSFEDYQGDYMGNKGRYIMFTNECTGSITYNYSFVARIFVSKIPTCRPVAAFSVDSIAEDAAMISWKQYSDSYRMMMSSEIVPDDKKDTYDKWLLDSVVTRTDSVLIENLKPATNYYVYAQALCEDGDSSAISMAYANILTNCPEISGYPVPYYNDFDEGPSGSPNKPLCWAGVYMTMDTVSTTQTYPYVYTTASYAASKPNSVYMYSYGYWNNTDKKYTSNTRAIAVAPKVAGDLNEYMVSFYARKGGTTASYGSMLCVGYVTDATLHGIDSTFVTIAKVEVTTATQQPYQVIISDYTNSIPAGARIALKADWAASDYPTPTANTSYYGTMYIDNFKIGMPPSCFPPTLEPGKTSLYTADVNIVPAKAWNDKWQIAVVPDSIYTLPGYKAAEYLACDTVRIVDADSANFVISGLTPGTLYWLYGRTNCGGDDGYSAWTDLAVSTCTKYYYGDSYFFGFERSEGEGMYIGQTSTATYYMHPALEYGYEGGTATTSYTTYWPYLRENSSETAIYAYGPADLSLGKGVLRWNATASYWGQYVIFPGVAEPKDRSFEFKVRAGYGLYVPAKDTMAVSSPADYILEIGTVDLNKGIETYQPLATMTKKALDKTKMTAENDWLWTSYTVDLDSTTIANKQIVIRNPKPAASVYMHVDNVSLGAPKGFGLVSIGKIQTESNKATVNWENIGGPWNLYITHYDSKTKKTDTVASYLDLTGVTSQVVAGLTPQTEYTAILVAASAPAGTKYQVSDSKTFNTPCLPLDPNLKGEFAWDFDDPNEYEASDVKLNVATDSLYKKPACFTVGTTYDGSQTTSTVYYNWLIQRKGYGGYTSAPSKGSSYDHYEYGRNDSYGALRIYSTSTYMTPYLALPELNCSFDTMMIEFWARPLTNYDDSYGTVASRNKMVSATYCGSTYSRALVVGTLTDPNDFSTLEVVDTLTYTAYTSTTAGFVTEDDNRYWQQMRLPLASAKGKYIVLFPPKEKTVMMFVDDLRIAPVGDNLFAPGRPSTSNVTTTSATFSWEAKHTAIQSVVVVTDQTGKSEILRDTIPGSQMTFTVDTLKPSSAYKWYMYQTNGKVETSTTAPLAFYTECIAVTPDYTNGFELEDGWRILPAQTSDTYKQTLCWTYENAGTSAIGTYEYNYANTTSYKYSYKGDYALRLYASGTTYQTYAAMPAMEDIAAYDTLQVNFWMRPAYSSVSTGKISTQYTLYSSGTNKEYYYSKSVIVGTMTDPMDPTTFVPVDTFTYNGFLATTDVVNEANNYLFQQKKAVLTGAKGKYVAFMATLWAKGAENKSTYDYIWIDDISFSAIQHCEAPDELTADDIAATSAKLSWKAPEGADKYILQVSTDYTYAEDTAFVYNDTVNTNSFVVTGMKAYTDYAWRVRTICESDLGESEFSQNSTFTTAREPFFVETFAATNLDAGWTFATNPAIKVIDSTNVELTGSNSTSYGWRRVTSNAGISGAHYAVVYYTYSASSNDYDYYWMVSPTITLNETATAHLTFDMALTGCSGTTTPSATPATEAQMADDYSFLIIISDDGGKTWKSENIVGIWNNTLPAGNQLRDIPFNPTNMRVNLEKYAGKTIRVAFYREGDTYKGTSPYSCAVHLDNIRINYYGMKEDNAEACQYEDINKLGFFINGDIAQAGDTTLRRLDKAVDFEAATKGDQDSIFVLNVKYNEAVTVVFEDTICEGETYSNHDFSGKTTSGLYKRKLQGVNHCDSLACLKLYVIPRKETSLEATICQGDVYIHPTHDAFQWKIDREGVYHDTLTSVETGCDSVLTLALHVQQPQISEFSAKACETTGYYWEAVGKTYTESGDFTEKLATIYGCDSTVTLHLTIAKLYQDSKTAEIKEGESYTFYGETYTKAGTYTVVVPGQDGECDSTHVLVLNVQTGLENVAGGNLMLMPNVIHAGESVTATGNFKGNVHVEVYDIVGRMILSEDRQATNKRITISAFDNSGVYTVRISDKLNTQFVGRVIVQ